MNMRQVLRRTSLVVPFTLIALVVGIPTAASDTDLQGVTLSCSDGTNVDLTLGLDAVTELTDAVTQMTLFPAGLTCGVTTQPDPPPGGNPRMDYNVGGGDLFKVVGFTPCFINFGFSANTPSNSPLGARGTFNLEVPGGCAPGVGGNKLQVRINCLSVQGNHADMMGTVAKATGSFFNDGFREGQPAWISDTDNSRAPFDTLGWSNSSVPAGPCGRATFEAETTHGNITVHDAQP
jgi:hypothetical protein